MFEKFSRYTFWFSIFLETQTFSILLIFVLVIFSKCPNIKFYCLKKTSRFLCMLDCWGNGSRIHWIDFKNCESTSSWRSCIEFFPSILHSGSTPDWNDSTSWMELISPLMRWRLVVHMVWYIGLYIFTWHGYTTLILSPVWYVTLFFRVISL